MPRITPIFYFEFTNNGEKFTGKYDISEDVGELISYGNNINTKKGKDKIHIGQTGIKPTIGLYIYGELRSTDSLSLIVSGSRDDIINNGRIFTGQKADEITGDIDNNGVIKTRRGNDTIRATNISNTGRMSMGNGNDSLSSSYISNKSKINMGNGDNRVTIGSYFGTYRSKLISGSGNDTFEITEYESEGLMKTGDGDDTIMAIGISENNSIINNKRLISMGNGEDTIEAVNLADRGTGIELYSSTSIDTGSQADTIIAVGSDYGIKIRDNTVMHGEEAKIFMGDGNDKLVARGELSISQFYYNRDYGYKKWDISHSMIDMGTGDDTVDVLIGTLSASIKLGEGNDTVISNGEGGTIFGEAGIDKVRLPEGEYTISSYGGSSIIPSGYQIKSEEGYQFNQILIGMEKIGGLSGNLFKIKQGILTINENDVAESLI